MKPAILKSVNTKVYRRFPEMIGVNPKVRKQSSQNVKTHSKKTSATSRYLITYQSEAKGVNGKVIPRLVRVVVDEKGKILKTTTSR